MIRVNSNLYHLDCIDLEAVSAVVIQIGKPEEFVSAKKLQAMVALCRNVAVNSNRVTASLLLEFVEEAERVGLRRAG